MPITTEPAQYYGNLNITRKIVAGFLAFLNNRIYVERYDDTGAVYRYIKVPLHHAQRERFMQIVKNNNIVTNNNTNIIELNKILPRMSLAITGLTYDPERKLPKHLKICSTNGIGGSGATGTVMSPVPYNIELELSILTKTMDDNYQIIEQLLPYFAPSFTQEINVLENYDPLSVQYTLNSVVPETNDEWGITDERIFLSTLTFTANTNYYYNKVNVGVIKEIITNFNVAGRDNSEYELFKSFELDVQSLTPTTTIDVRDTEPVTTTVTSYE